MALLQDWREYAYSEEMQNSKEGEKLALCMQDALVAGLDPANYRKAKGNKTYYMLKKTDADVPLSMMVGFLDGINDSLKEENPIETMDKDTVVKLDIDLEKLYYNMVDCKAEWLYSLPQWDNLLSEERRKELYKEQKNSGTIHNANRKVGRNDPCPCGSAKNTNSAADASFSLLSRLPIAKRHLPYRMYRRQMPFFVFLIRR